jgi:GH15 family glucan-1,4-alpha-glucosidase
MLRDTAPIGDYGLIGDCRSAALSSPSGSLDWCCLPRFDSEPIFAALLGGDGCFRMGPAEGTAELPRRRYRRDSAVLETRWRVGSAELTLTEGFVAEVHGRLLPEHLLVRRLSARGGPVDVSLAFDPRHPLQQRDRPAVKPGSDVLICRWGADALAVTTDPAVELTAGPVTRLSVHPGMPVTVAVSAASREPLVIVPAEQAWRELAATDRWWRSWAGGLDLVGLERWRDAVVRSLITLRLLTYAPSGAPVAAVTTSLPEVTGGERNWDYRYAWPRDASIGIAAFLGVDRVQEARGFLYWLLHAGRLHRPRLPAVLTLDGRRVPGVHEISGWHGYAGSRPVRFGNDAQEQHQLDGYGWVVDAGWVFESAGHRLFDETWRVLSGFADLVARRWEEPDSGIWEVPGPPRHYVHSKLMAWLALDRALRIAESHRTSARRRRRWTAAREAVTESIRRHGVDPERGCLVRAYGSRDLDAALLLLPMLEFTGQDDPLVERTIAAVRTDLSAGPDLLYRYPPGSDGLPGIEGAFLPCSFWLVQALARTGRTDQGGALFDRLLERAGSLGLYAEEIDPHTGEQVGNFPQALTHAALIQAALALRAASEGRAARPTAPRTPHGPRS